MDFIFLIQARLGSTRLPEKVLMKVFDNITLLELVYKRVLISKNSRKENVFVLTSKNPIDDRLEQYLIEKNINYFRGEENNVYKRFLDFLEKYKIDAKFIFRICGDNPFIEPLFINEMAHYLSDNENIDYLSYKDYKNIPAILTHYGLFCEAIKLSAFKKAKSLINNEYEKEHVTPIFYHTEYFNSVFLNMPDILYGKEYRFTVDTKEDMDVIMKILKNFKNVNFSYFDILEIIKKDNFILKKMLKNIIKNGKE